MVMDPRKWKHSLPCGQSDQLAQVATQIRTIRPGEASLYSTKWQMFE